MNRQGTKANTCDVCGGITRIIKVVNSNFNGYALECKCGVRDKKGNLILDIKDLV